MNNRRNLVILFFTLVVVMMGFGLIIPIMPFYIESFGASGVALGAMMSIFSVAQFILSPLWGSLSDRYGRKSILLVGAVGNALFLILFGLATQLWMLFAFRALAGILSAATLPTAMAYISDSTDERSRGGGMGIFGAAMGTGMVLGPALGGWLASDSLSLPFFVGAGLSILAVLAIVAFLPESLPVANREVGGRVSGVSLSGLRESLSGPIGYLNGLAFLVFFALTNFEAIFGLYAQYRYAYGPAQVGLILTVIGLVSALVQGAITGPVTRRFGEEVVIRASLAASAVGFIVMLFAWDFSSVLVTVGLFVFANAMLRPAISSLVSRSAGSQQGAVLGINNSFGSLGRIVGPLWAGWMIDVNLSFPYITGALIMAAVFIFGQTRLRREHNADKAPASFHLARPGRD
ncbi:MAG: MFS transporter [Anaerolineaceae bacterium]|nr:MFS transporter [Anaerolineaceae bacterium]